MKIYPLNLPLTQLACALDCYQDFVWLDSANGTGSSILAFESRESRTFDQNSSTEDFLHFLNQISKNRTVTQSHSHTVAPFWLGYLTYEAFSFNPLIPIRPGHFKNYPLAEFRCYDTFILLNNKTNQLNFVSSSDKANERYREFLSLVRKIARNRSFLEFTLKDLNSALTQNEYRQGFEAIKQSLTNGGYYELNFSMEFNGNFCGSTLGLYLKLRESGRAPMMSYLKFPTVTILSASPERFFKTIGNRIETWPIKGTAARLSDKNKDRTQKMRLQNNPKERAELLMVTDMLRNDLGRICQTGSVKVNKLNHVHTFPHYHHLISKISGVLMNQVTFSDVFCALFPGGSITGAPKIKVMEQIRELERRARGVYTGAIGYMSDNGMADFSIPIRTLTIQGNQLTYSAGGGIVMDSECNAEYEECLLKASVLSGLVHKTEKSCA